MQWTRIVICWCSHIVIWSFHLSLQTIGFRKVLFSANYPLPIVKWYHSVTFGKLKCLAICVRTQRANKENQCFTRVTLVPCQTHRCNFTWKCTFEALTCGLAIMFHSSSTCLIAKIFKKKCCYNFQFLTKKEESATPTVWSIYFFLNNPNRCHF